MAKHKTVTTVEHWEWSESEKDWVPTRKTVTTEEGNTSQDPLPWSPPATDQSQYREPYRPYWDWGLPQVTCDVTSTPIPINHNFD